MTMDLMIEILVELILDGTFELSQSKKTPNWLKIPLIIIVLTIYLGVSLVILLTGYLSFKEVPLVGLILIALGLIFIICGIVKFKNIYFKRNPNSDASVLWNRFIEQICPKKLSSLTDIQKNAVLCFYYDREMNIGGHVSYFDNYGKIKNEDLKKALQIVANKKYVENFEEAIATGKNDNYKATDSMYQKISPCLTEYIEMYVIKNKDNILIEKEEIF